MDMKTPRVNSARLHSYIGERVRVIAKVIKFQGKAAVVELSDGGRIDVVVSLDSNMRDEYVEIIGQVENSTTIKMFKAINLGSEIDMKVVNHTIELMHTRIMSDYWHTKP